MLECRKARFGCNRRSRNWEPAAEARIAAFEPVVADADIEAENTGSEIAPAVERVAAAAALDILGIVGSVAVVDTVQPGYMGFGCSHLCCWRKPVAAAAAAAADTVSCCSCC